MKQLISGSIAVIMLGAYFFLQGAHVFSFLGLSFFYFLIPGATLLLGRNRPDKRALAARINLLALLPVLLIGIAAFALGATSQSMELLGAAFSLCILAPFYCMIIHLLFFSSEQGDGLARTIAPWVAAGLLLFFSVLSAVLLSTMGGTGFSGWPLPEPVALGIAVLSFFILSATGPKGESNVTAGRVAVLVLLLSCVYVVATFEKMAGGTDAKVVLGAPATLLGNTVLALGFLIFGLIPRGKTAK